MEQNTPAGGAHGAPPVLARILEWPVRFAGAISALLIIATFVLVVYAVLQRYVLDEPLKWGDEMLGYMLVATVMCGAAEALRKGDHIAIDIVPARFSESARTIFDAISCLAVLALSIVLGVSSYNSVLFSYDFGSYSPGYLEAPMWIPQSTLILGSALLASAAAARLIRLSAQGSGS